jgi:V8-like Glu-specific endopeptidase
MLYFMKSALVAIAASSHAFADAADGAVLPEESASSKDPRQAGRDLYIAMQEHRRLGNGKDKPSPPIPFPPPSQERLTWLKKEQATETQSSDPKPHLLGLVEGFTVDASSTNEVCVAAEGSDGVRIHVQAPNDTEAYIICDTNGEATKLEFGEEGETWSPTCPGEEICLRVMSESGEGEVQINEHTFVPYGEGESIRRRLGDGRRLESLNCPVSDYKSCLVNSDCYSDAEPLRKAAAGYFYPAGGGYYQCSGALISSSVQSNPLFFTAAHCIPNSAGAAYAEFFGGALLQCGDPCTGSTPFWNLPLVWYAYGSTLKYYHDPTDIAILELGSSEDLIALSFYWSAEYVGDGDTLRVVGYPLGGPQVYSSHVTKRTNKICFPYENYIHATNEIGALTSGSSGGPVVNSNSQIVAVVTGMCGANYCVNVKAFGRLSSNFGSELVALLGPPPSPPNPATPTPNPATPSPSPTGVGCVYHIIYDYWYATEVFRLSLWEHSHLQNTCVTRSSHQQLFPPCRCSLII